MLEHAASEAVEGGARPCPAAAFMVPRKLCVAPPAYHNGTPAERTTATCTPPAASWQPLGQGQGTAHDGWARSAHGTRLQRAPGSSIPSWAEEAQNATCTRKVARC